MNELRSTLPWVAVIAVLGGAIGWLLARDHGAGKWLLGGFFVAHGLVHLLFTTPAPARAVGEPAWPFALLETWPVTALGLEPQAVRAVALALVAAVILAFALGGLATVGLLVPAAWWVWLLGAGAGLSAATLLCFFDRQLALGLSIDAALLWLAWSGAWSP